MAAAKPAGSTVVPDGDEGDEGVGAPAGAPGEALHNRWDDVLLFQMGYGVLCAAGGGLGNALAGSWPEQAATVPSGDWIWYFLFGGVILPVCRGAWTHVTLARSWLRNGTKFLSLSIVLLAALGVRLPILDCPLHDLHLGDVRRRPRDIRP
jgi:hypothetical protein